MTPDKQTEKPKKRRKQMNFIEGLAAVGIDHIQIQELNRVWLNAKTGKKRSTITFATTEELAGDMSRCACIGGTPKRFGVVVWIDSEKWNQSVNRHE